MPEILYKFIEEKWALKMLQFGAPDRPIHIRLSDPATFNDIYDLAVSFSRNNYERLAAVDEEITQRIIDVYGFVCFSASYSSPLMWGHYAKNSGIALGFSFAELESTGFPLIEVKYSKSPQEYEPATKNGRTLDGSGQDRFDARLPELMYKAPDWKYEEEWRLCVRLGHNSVEARNGMFYLPIPRCALKEIIIGPRSSMAMKRAKSILYMRKHTSAKVIFTDRASNEFRVIDTKMNPK